LTEVTTAYYTSVSEKPRRNVRTIKGQVRTMARAENWSKEEFEILLQNPQLTDEQLRSQLPRRSLGAIGVVRAFIHNFHKGGSISGVSKMMISRLEKGLWTCPICNEKQ